MVELFSSRRPDWLSTAVGAIGFRLEDFDIDGNGPEFRYMPVPLTTMCEEKRLIGKTAAELMGKMLNNEKIDNKLVKIKSKLIERESVKCLL